MWTCPKCGRTFAHQHQDHYCGRPPQTIDEYIESQDAMVQPLLIQLDQIIRSAIPHATRKIAWSMPTYHQKTNLIQYAAFKKHIGLYPGAEAVQAFKDQLSSYKTHKGTIQLPYDQPLPFELIQTIAKWCLHHYGH